MRGEIIYYQHFHMKTLLRSFIASALCAVVIAISQPAQATQYSFAANVENTEQAGKKPIPTLVTWVQSAAAEDGDVMLDHFEVVLIEADTEETVGTVTAAVGATSVTLSKANLPEMKVYTKYNVRVDEYYTDDTMSEGYDATFYTAPPRLKNVRVKDKTLEDDGDMTVTLKWRMPTNLRGDYLYYDYKITYPGNTAELVVEDYTWGADVNSATISNLPARKLQIQVRARDDNYGSGQWSAWKKFNAPVAE
jgi:hypothetical protein